MGAEKKTTRDERAYNIATQVVQAGFPKPDWIQQAACADKPFLPHVENPGTALTNSTARRFIRTYCDPCPVKRECLQDAALSGLPLDKSPRGGYMPGEVSRIRGAAQLILKAQQPG